VAFAATKYGDADAEEGYKHCQYAFGSHVLTKGNPCCQCGRDWGECHKELTEARTDDDVTLKEAEVANDISHQT